MFTFVLKDKGTSNQGWWLKSVQLMNFAISMN